MAGSFRKLDAAFDTQAQLLGIFDNVVNALPGAGLLDLLAVDQCVRVDDTGGQSANRHHRLID